MEGGSRLTVLDRPGTCSWSSPQGQGQLLVNKTGNS